MITSCDVFYGWGRKKRDQTGFTLVELLAVVTVITILASLLLPALAKVKSKSAGVFCVNNNKQLHLAWQQYTDDNDGTLLFASENLGNPKTRAATWVTGTMDNDPSNRSNYDTKVDIKTSPLWIYAQNSFIWKCPADPSKIRVRGRDYSRVRSMAMSIWVGGFGGEIPPFLDQRYRVYRKFSDAIDPGPSNTWLFLDQRHNSINWGNFFTSMRGFRDMPDQYVFIQDVPASYHHRAAGISFFDGHVEIHSWRDSRTINQVGPIHQSQPISSPHNTDIAWLQERATRRK